jgi:hypothetical protein
MWRLIALICLVLGLSFQQASAQSKSAKGAQCSSAGMTLPNLNALKLPDGEHVVGMIETEVGKLEARVKVKGGEVSDPDYYLRGMRLTETPNSNIPKSIRACLNRKSSAAGASWFANALDWIVPPAEAAKRCIAVIVTGSGHCRDDYKPGEGICCATARCGSSYATMCATYPVAR